MAFTSKQVTVGTTAVSIFTGDTDGNLIYLTLVDNGHIYLGGPGVTTSNGMKLEHLAGMAPAEIKVGAGEALYGISDNSEVVTVLITNW